MGSECLCCDNSQLFTGHLAIDPQMDIKDKDSLIKVFNFYLHQDEQTQLAVANIKQKQKELTQKIAAFEVFQLLTSDSSTDGKKDYLSDASPHQVKAFTKIIKEINSLAESILTSAFVINARREFIEDKLTNWIGENPSKEENALTECEAGNILAQLNAKYEFNPESPILSEFKFTKKLEDILSYSENGVLTQSQIAAIKALYANYDQIAEDLVTAIAYAIAGAIQSLCDDALNRSSTTGESTTQIATQVEPSEQQEGATQQEQTQPAAS